VLRRNECPPQHWHPSPASPDAPSPASICFASSAATHVIQNEHASSTFWITCIAALPKLNLKVMLISIMSKASWSCNGDIFEAESPA